MATYFVYILASRSRTLYTGVTKDLERRLYQHRAGEGSAFTSKYRNVRLVYFEWTANVWSAIAREKQIKGWRRDKKLALINAANPTWKDLSSGWQTADSSLRSE